MVAMVKSDLLLATADHLSMILAVATFDFMPLHLAIKIVHSRWVMLVLALVVAQAHRRHLFVA